MHNRDFQRPKRRGRGRASRRSGSIAWGSIRLMVLGGVSAGLVWAFYGPDVSAGTSTTVSGAVAIVDGPVSIVDGDTFRYRGEKIRIADIDAPEVKGRCPYETELAAQATDRLEELLDEGAFELSPIGTRDEDQYGRKLRIVSRNGRSIGDQLVEEGLARTWTGRREPWC